MEFFLQEIQLLLYDLIVLDIYHTKMMNCLLFNTLFLCSSSTSSTSIVYSLCGCFIFLVCVLSSFIRMCKLAEQYDSM